VTDSTQMLSSKPLSKSLKHGSKEWFLAKIEEPSRYNFDFIPAIMAKRGRLALIAKLTGGDTGPFRKEYIEACIHVAAHPDEYL
jgi:hypothetical protein